MNAVCLILAAALVPWPKEAKFTGGDVKVTKPTYAVNAKLPREGYRISVTKGGVKVWSATDAGRFYAEKTLEQLAEDGRYACCEIVDEPVFGYRGFHIDEARHFFGKDAIKKVIDEMSRLKFNHFHWHLTDDQGWRIQLKKYPELTEYGSWRVSSPVFGKMWQRKYDNTKYGPFFYTEEEAREIVAYAAARQITVVPEVDLPGHCQGLLAGYPWMLCEGERLKPRCARNNWWLAGIRTLCIGNDEALAQVEGIIDELMGIFPGEYFHFGGDECPDRYWAKCPKCRARMEKEGLKKPHELQHWFSRRFAKYILSKGRKPIGWHEILSAGDLPKGTVIMSWRGTGAGIAAAKQGLQSIMAPGDWCNLNRWDGNSAINEFTASGDLPGGDGLTMDHVHSFDPLAGVPDGVKGNVIGGQCCCWSESVFTSRQLEWRLFPRAGAIAEGLWSAGGKTGYRDFRRRIDRIREKMSARGVCVSEIVDVAKLAVATPRKIRVEWGTDVVEFEVPRNDAKKWRLDAIVRGESGRIEYHSGEDGATMRDCGRLAGTVFLPAGCGEISEDSLYPCRACRPWIRHNLWNSPFARDFAPKTLKKLRAGGEVRIVVVDDGTAADWSEQFAARLKAQYAKTRIEFVRKKDAKTVDVVAANPDLVITLSPKESVIGGDIAAIERGLAEKFEAFTAKGIEWIICQPHFLKPEAMGRKTAKACAESDTRPYYNVVRKFAAQHKVGIADTTRYWAGLACTAVPYETLLEEDGLTVTRRGAEFYADALMDLFEELD